MTKDKLKLLVENRIKTEYDKYHGTDIDFIKTAASKIVENIFQDLKIELEDWDHTCGDGCCYNYGQDIYLNGEKLDESNAEDSVRALKAVLTELGYEVEINH